MVTKTKSKVEAELLTALKIKRKVAEKEQALFTRIAEAADELDDEEYTALSLSKEAQLWLNSAAKAVKKEQPIPGFTDNGDDEEEEEEEKPAKKSRKAAAKEETDDDAEEEDEEEDEKPAKKRVKAKADPKRKSDDDAEEDDKEESEEEEEAEEEEKPRAAKSRKTTAKRKAAEEDDDDEAEEEDEEDEKPVKKTAKRASKSDDEDDDEKPAKKAKKPFGRKSKWKRAYKKILIKNPALSVEGALKKLPDADGISRSWATTVRLELVDTLGVLAEMNRLAE